MRIVSTGSYLPARILSNDQLAEMVETSDEWIVSRTGISERRIAEDESTTDLACKAAQAAIESAGIAPSDIGLLITATFTPDYATPSVACMVQSRLGLAQDLLAFDLNAACSGFVYSLAVAQPLLAAMPAGKYALIIGAETISRVVDYTDRGTCILFGDGAGAVVAQHSEQQIYSVFGSQGNDQVLYSRCPGSTEKLGMNGKDVFRFAVENVPQSINELMHISGETLDSIDYFVCHQANHRILEGVSRRLGVGMERFFENISKYGNTSAASVPIVLDEMNRKGLLTRGKKLVLSGFGGGLTWGSILLNW